MHDSAGDMEIRFGTRDILADVYNHNISIQRGHSHTPVKRRHNPQIAMFSSISTLQILFIAISVTPIIASSPFKSTNGFINPTFTTSAGGHADCLSGHIRLPITTSSNTKLLFKEPANQYEVTDAFLKYLQANSSQAKEVDGGPATISETFDIEAKLCYPKNWSGTPS